MRGPGERAPCVLLVDDEPMILAALEAFFALEGDWEVVAFECPLQALEQLRSRPVDLILSDFLMPGMDGLELLRRARDIDPLVPRILLTGYADKESALRAINDVGLFRYVDKPWCNDALRRMAGEALRRRRLLCFLRAQGGELATASQHLEELQGALLQTPG